MLYLGSKVNWFMERLMQKMVTELKHASRKNNAPIWSKLAKSLLKPSPTKKTVNIKKINDFSEESNIVVVPGKVLGMGNISHKITLCSFSISTSAAKKIIESGGQILKFTELIEKNPSGNGVKIIGWTKTNYKTT